MCRDARIFYITTATGSVYEVVATGDARPVVTKIVQGRSALVVGSILNGGTHLGITGMGATMYTPGLEDGRPVRAEMINTRGWGGTTTKIVGLFLEQSAAEACAAASEGLGAFDPRWRQETSATIEVIRDMERVVLDSNITSLVGG